MARVSTASAAKTDEQKGAAASAASEGAAASAAASVRAVESSAAPINDPTPIADVAKPAQKIEFDIWHNPTDRDVIVEMPQRSAIKPGERVRLNRALRKAWLEMAPQLECVEPAEAVADVARMRAALSIGLDTNTHPGRTADRGE